MGGEGEPPLDPGSRKIVFGVKAVDSWIAQMKGMPFCPACKSNAKCASAVATAVLAQVTFSSGYLRMTAQRMPAAREHLDSAASHYERIASWVFRDAGPNHDGRFHRTRSSLDVSDADIERQDAGALAPDPVAFSHTRFAHRAGAPPYRPSERSPSVRRMI